MFRRALEIDGDSVAAHNANTYWESRLLAGKKIPPHGQKPDAPGQMTFFGRRQGEVPCTGKPQKPIGVRERLRPPTERSPGKETVIFLPPFSWRGA